MKSNLVVVIFTKKFWAAQSKDVKMAQEVARNAGARDGDATVTKKLLPGVEEHTLINKQLGAMYTWHRKKTAPWSDNNERVMLPSGVIEYKKEFGVQDAELERLIDNFCKVYPSLIDQLEFRLNGLYDRKLYPPVDKIRSKFGARIEMRPLVNTDDFRNMGLPQEEVDAQIAEAEKRAKERVTSSMSATWAKLYGLTKAMADKLSVPVGEQGSIFRDSLVGNVRDMLDILPTLNLTNDPKLDAMAKAMRLTIAKFEPQTLRDSPETRAKVAAKAAELSQRMANYFNTDDAEE